MAKQPRDVKMVFRVTPEEKSLIERSAVLQRTTTSIWLRQVTSEAAKQLAGNIPEQIEEEMASLDAFIRHERYIIEEAKKDLRKLRPMLSITDEARTVLRWVAYKHQKRGGDAQPMPEKEHDDREDSSSSNVAKEDDG